MSGCPYVRRDLISNTRYVREEPQCQEKSCGEEGCRNFGKTYDWPDWVEQFKPKKKRRLSIE